jgi:precorrin-3B synthase
MCDLVAAEVFAIAGLIPTARRRTPARGLPVGKQPGGAFGIGAAFGQMSAGDLAELATLARQHGDATLRLSPWRVILLPGITETPATRLITDPADPLLGMQACPGMPFCGAASVRTLDDATALVAAARGRGIHVSGCAKGCAHRLPSAITLVGENGVYNLIRNGRADSPPVLRGQSISVLAAILTAERLP